MAQPLLAQLPPRYQLQPGDYLVYDRTAHTASPDARHERRDTPTSDYQDTIHIACLDAQGTEWLMLAVLVRQVGARQLPATGVAFHMDARGRKRFSAHFRNRLGDLDPVFELLPQCRATLDSPAHWSTDADTYGRRWQCANQPATAGGSAAEADDSNEARVAITLDDLLGVSDVLGLRIAGEYTFDRAQGVLSNLDLRIHRRPAGHTDPGGRQTQVRARLVERCVFSRAWCGQRVNELDALARAIRHEDRYLATLETDPAQLDSLLQRVDAVWRELDRELAAAPGALEISPGSRALQSPLRLVAQGRRDVSASLRGAYIERARLAAQWNGRSAPNWSLPDIDGRMLTSEQVRDRTCVECYWRCDDAASLRMMQTLRELQAAAPANSLRIVCINLDVDAEAGRAGAKRCGADLQHVFAGQPLEPNWPAESPLVRIIDADGRVKRVVAGWRASLLDACGIAP